MPVKPWSVWSLSLDGAHWMEVAEDLQEAEAVVSAARRDEYAEKHGFHAQYIAMPHGEKPGPEHVRPEPAVALPTETTPEPEPAIEPVPGTPTRPGRWFDDYAQIVGFAAILNEADEFLHTAAVIDYFEKPWKWNPEYERWVELDHPDSSDAGSFAWRHFRAYLDER